MIQEPKIPIPSSLEDLRAAVQKAIAEVVRQVNKAKPTSPVDLAGQRITSLARPSYPTDAATKAYVDSVVVAQRQRAASSSTVNAEGLTTPDVLPKVASPNKLTDSAISDDGTAVTVAGRTLQVNTPGATATQGHYCSASPADLTGAWVGSNGASNAHLAGGMAYNGSAWVARASTAGMVHVGASGVRIYFDTGLSVGSTFSPTAILLADANGITVTGMANATTGFAVGAATGLTSSRTVVSAVVPITGTIGYKDWAGANQSMTVQTATTVTTTTHGFTGGILTT